MSKKIYEMHMTKERREHLAITHNTQEILDGNRSDAGTDHDQRNCSVESPSPKLKKTDTNRAVAHSTKEIVDKPTQ